MKDLSRYGILKEKGRDYEEITYVLALVYNLINARAEAYFARYGLNVTKFNVLMLAAYQNDGNGLNQRELAGRLVASASNVAKVVESLVRAGLLSRAANPKSRRENVIRITVAGRKLIDAVWPEYDVLVRGLTNKIPAVKRKAAKEILNGWFEKLQEEEK